MRKLLNTYVALSGFVFPSVAQVSHDFNPNDRKPDAIVTITKDQVSVAVRKLSK